MNAFQLLTKEVPVSSSNSKYLHRDLMPRLSARFCLEPAACRPASVRPSTSRPPSLHTALMSCVSRSIVFVISSKVGCEERSGSAYRSHGDSNQINVLCVYMLRSQSARGHESPPPLLGTRLF